MSGRLPTHVLAGALLRRAAAAGGFGMLLARGEREAGALVLVCREAGRTVAVRELATGPDGKRILRLAGPESPDDESVTAWIERRRRYDPDLWIVELDIADAERFAAETIGLN